MKSLEWRVFHTDSAMVKPKASPDATPMPATYEAAVQELEALVGRLDAGQLPLDDLLAQYRRGELLLQFCRERLAAVEQQIQVLDSSGLRPWSAGPA